MYRRFSAPSVPRSLRVTQNTQDPYTKLQVYFKPSDTNVDGYVVSYRNVMEHPDMTKEIYTKEEFMMITGLSQQQSYIVWVQSRRGDLRSQKVMLQEPVATAEGK